MCGISGVLRYRHLLGAPEREGAVRMIEALSHRGPDGEGRHEDGPVLLGHRRLAIIDLSEAARQPLRNETGDVALTFNGEIYNFVELRRELSSLGHAFRSQTDAEVVVHGYEAWGIERLLERLRGMFAFALWDGRARKLFLVRDRFGIKPLYYVRAGETLLFASEISALAASRLIEVEPSEAALTAFLAFGSVPAPETALRGVVSILPAHYLEVSAEGEKLTRYWKLPVGETEDGDDPKVAELLRDAVRLHLMSDVPLGVFLSGGIDSASLVALASGFADEPLTTIAIVFDDPELDESVYARKVAEKYQTRHREIRIGASEFLDALPEFWRCMDQPTVDGVNSYLVSRAAREAGLTVVLTGVGGDEVFLGYPHFRKIRTLSRAPILLRPLAALRSFQPRLEYLRKPNAANVYATFRGLFAPSEIAELLPGAEPAALAAEQSDFLDAAVELEFSHYLQNQLLRDTDAMSMAHGIEARVSFLDHRLVEAVVRIPYDVKLSRRVNKPLLLSSLDDPLPREVWDRPKQGFTLPFRRFLTEHRDELTANTIAAGVFHEPAVRKLWKRFLEGRTHWSRPWALVAYASWRERTSRLRSNHEPAELTAARA